MADCMFAIACRELLKWRHRVQWYKGNIHCHTLNSDGDLTPKAVADLYKHGGYDFICITDHNHVTDPFFREQMILIR